MVASSSVVSGEEEDIEDNAPGDLDVGATPFAVVFHPRESSIGAFGLVSGEVLVYDVCRSSERSPVARLASAGGSCRVVGWAGDSLMTGYESGQVRLWSCERSEVVFEPEGPSDASAVAGSACSCVSMAEEDLNCFLVGDDEGGVSLFDLRRRNAVRRKKHHEDFVADLAAHSGLVLGAGADGRLSVSDPRRNLAALGISDPQDDELLSLRVMKRGRKVVCGTQTGALVVWSWNHWGDSSDRCMGHPESVDAMLKVDDDLLCTGSSDGLLRVVRVLPGLRLLGVLGDHDGFPIERLAFNCDQSLVASLSHDSLVRFWDAQELRHLQQATPSSLEETNNNAIMTTTHDQSNEDMEDEDMDDDDAWETSSGDSDDDDHQSSRPGPPTMQRPPPGGNNMSSRRNNTTFFDGL